MTRKLAPYTAPTGGRDVEIILPPDLAREKWKADEAAGVNCVKAEPAPEADSTGEGSGSRDASGRFLSGPATRAIAAKGGAALKGRSKLAERVGLRRLPDGHTFSAYRRSAATFRRTLCAYFQEIYGEVSPDVGALITNASIELAAARAITDSAALQDLLLATRGAGLHVLARENIMAAHALAKLEAEARRANAAASGSERPQIRILYPADIDSDDDEQPVNTGTK